VPAKMSFENKSDQRIKIYKLSSDAAVDLIQDPKQKWPIVLEPGTHVVVNMAFHIHEKQEKKGGIVKNLVIHTNLDDLAEMKMTFSYLIK
jgi:hypothetical protein